MMVRARRVVAAAVSGAVVAGTLGACGPRQPWQNELVSVNADGTGTGNGASTNPVLSPDGTKIALQSMADDLGPTDTNGVYDVYVRDLVTGTTSLVSVNAAGTDSGSAGSVGPAFSPDGNRITFRSNADDLGPTDTNGTADVYVRDLASGTTSLVSVNVAGTNGGNGESTEPVFSPDGARIAFESQATDLGPADNNRSIFYDGSDVYVRDLVSGTTSLVSANAVGTGGGNWRSEGPVFSPDGTKIAFTSQANDLGPPDATPGGLWGGGKDVYLRDLVSGTTSLVSVNATGTGSGDSSSERPVFAPDASRIAFTSLASNLGPTDNNRLADVYVRDLAAGATALVSTNAAGTDSGNEASGSPHLSRDGTKVVFESVASDLGPTDTNADVDIYVRDLARGRTTLVSANAAGTDASGGFADAPHISLDGSKASFRTTASDLGPTDTNGTWDLYARDLVAESTTLVSTNAAGTDSANALVTPVGQFDPGGRRIVFVSRSSNIVASGDTNGTYDVFVATLRGADLSIEGEGEPDPVEPGGVVTYRFDVVDR